MYCEWPVLSALMRLLTIRLLLGLVILDGACKNDCEATTGCRTPELCPPALAGASVEGAVPGAAYCGDTGYASTTEPKSG